MEQTVKRFILRKTQREAAIEAVRHVGMHQIKDIDEEIFEDMTVWKEMFF